jgi:hypothetical protein
VREYQVTVTCEGCGSPIYRPMDADMELFRLGVHVHLRVSCLEAYARKMEERVMAREQRRQRDADDGIIWSDDH